MNIMTMTAITVQTIQKTHDWIQLSHANWNQFDSKLSRANLLAINLCLTLKNYEVLMTVKVVLTNHSFYMISGLEKNECSRKENSEISYV